VVKKDVKPISGFLAILFGGIATSIWEWGLNPNEIPSLLIGIIFNQLAFWGSELIFRNPIKNHLFQPIKE
jgi:hypothetical protein